MSISEEIVEIDVSRSRRARISKSIIDPVFSKSFRFEIALLLSYERGRAALKIDMRHVTVLGSTEEKDKFKMNDLHNAQHLCMYKAG